MPIYEYECGKCLRRFELKRQLGGDGGSTCPECGNEARRLFSPVPVVFKGSGFYVTDTRKNSDHGTNDYKPLSDAKKIGKSHSGKKESK